MYAHCYRLRELKIKKITIVEIILLNALRDINAILQYSKFKNNLAIKKN